MLGSQEKELSDCVPSESQVLYNYAKLMATDLPLSQSSQSSGLTRSSQKSSSSLVRLEQSQPSSQLIEIDRRVRELADLFPSQSLPAKFEETEASQQHVSGSQLRNILELNQGFSNSTNDENNPFTAAPERKDLTSSPVLKRVKLERYSSPAKCVKSNPDRSAQTITCSRKKNKPDLKFQAKRWLAVYCCPAKFLSNEQNLLLLDQDGLVEAHNVVAIPSPNGKKKPPKTVSRSVQVEFIERPIFMRASTPRVQKTPEQLAILEKEFKNNPFAGAVERVRIAKASGLTDTKIRLWFQHQRNKLTQRLRCDSQDDM